MRRRREEVVRTFDAVHFETRIVFTRTFCHFSAVFACNLHLQCYNGDSRAGLILQCAPGPLLSLRVDPAKGAANGKNDRSYRAYSARRTPKSARDAYGSGRYGPRL